MGVALNASDFYYRVVLEELKSFSNYSNWPDDLLNYHKNSLAQSKLIAENARKATANFIEKVY